MSYQFASPWYLLLLLIIPGLALLGRRPSSRRPAALRYADVTLAQTAVSSWRTSFRFLLPGLRWLALALLIFALARPQRVTGQNVVRGEGVDIALALDISGSMAALDFEPENRLEAAKRVIADFVQNRPFDRIGLVVFTRDAFTQSPLTVDHRVLNRLLAEIDLGFELGLEDGTAIGMGLANAANMLQSSTGASKVVILLTDGVNNAGQIDPVTAAQAAEALGIKIYTIGVGREGQVPVPHQSVFGTQIVYTESELDEETLLLIAEMTDGRFYRAADENELRQIYNEIDQLEKSEVEIRVFNEYEELAILLLLPALGLLLLELLLRQTLLRRLP